MLIVNSWQLIANSCAAKAVWLVVILTPNRAIQREYDICSDISAYIIFNNPGDWLDVYYQTPHKRYPSSLPCRVTFETCNSCRFKVSAVQPQFEYPECGQPFLSETMFTLCLPNCIHMILLDRIYTSRHKRARDSLMADGFETESKTLEVMACANENAARNITMRLRITSVEKIQYIFGNMLELSSDHTFWSPNYPYPYVRNNEYYLYVFGSSLQDQFITVTFDDWMLSSYSTVKFDGANIVNRISGDNKRPYVISSGMSMNMTFYTGEHQTVVHDYSYIGFEAVARFYRRLNDIPNIVTDCDRMLSTSEGGILHLNQAADGQNRDCIWIIKKMPGFDGVYLKIIRYKTRYELMNSCDYSLEVRGGLTSNATQQLNIRPNEYISHIAVKRSDNGFYIRIKGCYFDDSVVVAYAMFLDDCESPGEYYKCDNGRCIADNLRCDTYDHCGDNSDEIPSICGRNPSKIRTGVDDYSSNNVSRTGANNDYSSNFNEIIISTVFGILGLVTLCLLVFGVCRWRRINCFRNAITERHPQNGRVRRYRGRQPYSHNRALQMSVTMSSGEHPPSYEEVIQNTPIGQLNMAFSWSAYENSFTQPPSYDESVSPSLRTAQLTASTSSHTAATHSNSSTSTCHSETCTNLPLFRSHPFIIATLSASLCQAVGTSLSSGSSEETSGVLDVSSSSDSSASHESANLANCERDNFFAPSGQNENRREINSEIGSDENIFESRNITNIVPNSRTRQHKSNVGVSSNNSHSNNKARYDKAAKITSSARHESASLANCERSKLFAPSGQNQNRREINSEIGSDVNIVESRNITNIVPNSRTRQDNSNVGVSSNNSHKNNKAGYDKAVKITGPRYKNVNRNDIAEARIKVNKEMKEVYEEIKCESSEDHISSSVGIHDLFCENDMYNDDARVRQGVSRVDSQEANRKKKQRSDESRLNTDCCRTDSEQNFYTFVTPLKTLNNVSSCGSGSVNRLRIAQSSRSLSCADLSLDIERSELLVGQGNKLLEDKRFSYAGTGDVSLKRDLDPFCNSSSLIMKPQQHLSKFFTNDLYSQMNANQVSENRSRIYMTESAEDNTPNCHNHFSSQVAELPRSIMNKLSSSAPSGLSLVLENSYEEGDFKTISSDYATRNEDPEPSRNSNNATKGHSQDVPNSKWHYMPPEKETSVLESKQWKPDVLPKITKQKSRHTYDYPEIEHAQPLHNMSDHLKKHRIHNPEYRQNGYHPNSMDKFQNQCINNPQNRKGFTRGSEVQNEGHNFSHWQAENRNSRENVAMYNIISFDQKKEIPTADAESKVIRPPRKPKPAPRIHDRSKLSYPDEASCSAETRMGKQ